MLICYLKFKLQKKNYLQKLINTDISLCILLVKNYFFIELIIPIWEVNNFY